jgi:tetratricopeptide (TPR) repeat protein
MDTKGYTLGKLGKYNEAIQAYDRVIQIDSNYTDAWNEKGLSLKKLGKDKDVKKCLIKQDN